MFNQSTEDELSKANGRKRFRIVTISMTLWLNAVPVHTRLLTRTSDSKCSEVCRLRLGLRDHFEGEEL